MNKGRRNELVQLKRKKRLKLYKADPSQKWTHKLKNHGALCSCSICSCKKYNRAKVKNGATVKQIYGQQSLAI